MDARASAPGQLALIAVIAGAAQIAAGVALGVASGERLAAAASEGSTVYVLGLSGAMVAGLAAWLLRRRPPIALAVALALTLVAAAIAGPRGTALGLAYHGEFILHHFLTLVSAAICLLVAQGWANDPGLGRLRAAPLLAAALGVLALVGQHVASLPFLGLGLDLELPRILGELAIFAALPLAIAALWRRIDGWQERLLLVGLLAPLAARLALGGGAGLSGAQLGVSAAAPLTAALVVAGLVAFLLLRPRIDGVTRGAAILVGAVVSWSVHWLYTSPKYTAYEDRLGGLLRSIVGFELPFPSFVDPVRRGASAVIVFALVTAIVSAALDPWQRRRALALGLMVVAGLGLTSPQLILMQAAGSLLLIAALAEAPVVEVEPIEAAPPEEPELIFHELAERLEVEAPVVVEEAAETVIALRGELRRVALDLRARSADGRRWRVIVRVGVLGRGSPDAEVLADPASGSHRLRGDARLVGGEESGVLASLSAFPDAGARFWAAGVEVELGDDLARLGASSLDALVRALCRQLDGRA